MLPESTTEKTALLMRAMDWQWHWFDDDDRLGWYLMSGDVEVFDYYDYYGDEDERPIIDLYDTGNMALAWRVLNWGYLKWQQDRLDGFADMVMTDTLWYLYELPPAKAQAAWLDKVLELAIEAGRVEMADA